MWPSSTRLEKMAVQSTGHAAEQSLLSSARAHISSLMTERVGIDPSEHILLVRPSVTGITFLVTTSMDAYTR